MSKTRWSKEQKIILKIVKPFGFTLAKGKTHYKILNDQGKMVAAFAGSPSEPHWYKNVVNKMIKDGLLPGVKKL